MIQVLLANYLALTFVNFNPFEVLVTIILFHIFDSPAPSRPHIINLHNLWLFFLVVLRLLLLRLKIFSYYYVHHYKLFVHFKEFFQRIQTKKMVFSPPIVYLKFKYIFIIYTFILPFSIRCVKLIKSTKLLVFFSK